ncbi:putative ribonuclease H-like domain-containing protein [Tanacetum coccineum]
MDVKSAFLYGKIDEEVYVSQPPGFQDPKYPEKVYKVVKALYGLHQAPRACRFQMSSMGELTFFLGLQVKQKPDGIFISQDKYVAEILKKFDFASVKTASTPIETQKPLVKDEEASDVDVHLYRSMIGSLMYVTASRPDIMFAVCACSREIHNRRCKFLQETHYVASKKQTIVATSTTEAEYVAAASCCGQVLWIQNQMLDYGFNFMNTKIYIDNESTICIVKNPLVTRPSKLVPPGQSFTAKESLEKNTAKSWPSTQIAYLEKTEGNVEFHEVIDFLRRSYVYHALTVPFEQQPDPSPRPSPRPSPQPSPTPIVPDSIPEPTGENLGDHSSNDISLSGNEDEMTLPNVYDLCISLCKQVSDQAKEIKLLKAQITKLKKQAKPVIKHFKAYLKTVSLQQRLPRKSSSKKHRMHKESVSKQGRKIAKGESSVQRDPLFDVMPEDNIDHMETENAQSEGRTREMVDEDKEIDEVRLSTEDVVSTDKEGVSTDFEKVSTDFEKVSTDKPIVSTDGSKVSTDEQVEGTEEHNEGTEEIFESTEEQREGTEEKVESTAGQTEGTEDQTKEEVATQASQTSSQTPTSMIFGDDETIATLLLNMSQAKAASKEKEKGVELKDVEEIDRPRPTTTRSLLTLKPLPKIDPKDKGKKKIEEEDESESEDDDIPQVVKKFKQLESDEELAKKIQEEWEAKEERNKIAEEKATNKALIKNFDDIKARIEADIILAEKLQEQEREQFTIEERAKFLHDTIAAQRKFLAQQRSEAIRNKPPTKNQLRNQMMTYLKHVGNFKHSELKSKKFEDIQAMYEKIKRSDEDFIAIGSIDPKDKGKKKIEEEDESESEDDDIP